MNPDRKAPDCLTPDAGHTPERPCPYCQPDDYERIANERRLDEPEYVGTDNDPWKV